MKLYILLLCSVYMVQPKPIKINPLSTNIVNRLLKYGVKSDMRRQKRYVLQNTLWTKSIVTWRVDKYTRDLPKRSIRRILKRAFRKWAVWIPNRFEEKKFGEIDISITFVRGNHKPCRYPFDGKDGDIAHAYYPYQGQDMAGDIHFDDDEFFTNNKWYGRSLAWTALHEIGHSLGLKHSNVWGAVMSPYYNSFYHPVARLSLSTDDIIGIQSLYGDPLSIRNNGQKSINNVFNNWFETQKVLNKYLHLL